MILLIYGEDTFRSRQKLNEIVARFKKSDPSGMNLVTFDMSEKNLGDFTKAVGSAPFMGDKRLVIARNLLAEGNKDLQESVSEFIGSGKVPAETTVLFYEDKKIDKRKKLYKQLQKSGKSEECQQLPEYQVGQWVADEIKNRQGEIEPAAVERLASYVGNDLWKMDAEISKLLLYRQGQPVRAEDVELLVKAKLDDDVFHLVDAIGDRDVKSALKLLHDQFEQGENEIRLLSMIVYQFRNLAQIRPLVEENNAEGEIRRLTKLHPYVVTKTVRQARRFSLAKIQKIYDMLLRTDIAMKTSKLDKQTALDLLVVGLCK